MSASLRSQKSLLGSQRLQELSESVTDGVKTCLVSAHDEMFMLEAYYGPHSLPVEIVHFLHGMRVQILMIMLLCIDVVLIIVELSLDMQFPPCHILTRDTFSCCQRNASLPREEDVYPYYCTAQHMVPQRRHPVGCDYYAHPAVNVAHTVLFATTISILAIFLLELLTLLVIEGTIFLRNPLYVMDLLVVGLAMSLEIYLKTIDADGLAALSNLLVLSRTWRFVRVGHAIYMVDTKQRHIDHVSGKHGHTSGKHSSHRSSERFPSARDHTKEHSDCLEQTADVDHATVANNTGREAPRVTINEKVVELGEMADGASQKI